MTAPSTPKSGNRVEFDLAFSDELLRTSLMVICEPMKPSPNADSILQAKQDIQKELNADCHLRYFNHIYNLMTTASGSG